MSDEQLKPGDVVRWVLPSGNWSGRFRLEDRGETIAFRNSDGKVTKEMTKPMLAHQLKIGRLRKEAV